MEADELRAKSIDELLDLYDELRENEFCNLRDKKESDEEAFDEEAFGEEDYYDAEFDDEEFDEEDFKGTYSILDDYSFDESSYVEPVEGEVHIMERSTDARYALRSIICEKYNQEIAESDVEGAEEYSVVFSDKDTIDQIRQIKKTEKLPKNIQAYILNLSAPSSIDELVEILRSETPRLDIEEALDCTSGPWTAPRWAKAGDIIFYTHAKTARTKISAAYSELKRNKDLMSKDLYEELERMVRKEIGYHSEYGGTVFAVGRLAGAPSAFNQEELVEGLHYSSRVFAEIKEMVSFSSPLRVDDCKDFLHISMTSGVTPIDGDVFDTLKTRLKENNTIPRYLEESTATILPLSKINETNWMTLSNEFRRTFMYEAQFRHYYVDHLLKALSGRKTIYRECRCKKIGIGNSYIDNVIKLDDKYLPVEVKLSVLVEKNIKKQVRKYCFDDFIVLDVTSGRTVNQSEVYNNRVLIVDTFSVYMYDYEADEIDEVISLDEIVDMESVYQLRERVKKRLNVV